MKRRLLVWLVCGLCAVAFVAAGGYIATRIGDNTRGIAVNSAKLAHISDLQRLRATIALDRAHDLCIALNATRRSQRAVITLTENRLRESLRDKFVTADSSPAFRQFLVAQIRSYDVVFANLEPKPCPAPASLERAAFALASSSTFAPIIPPPYRTIGGARCQAQQPRPRGGVICFYPARPWAVGITSSTVFVWKRNDLMFVRSNR